MKNLVIPFLGVIMLVVSSCIDKGDNIGYFYNEPAQFTFSENLQPMIKTGVGTFLAPELAAQSLNTYDWIWAKSFSINYDNQAYSDVYTISNLDYIRVYTQDARSVPADQMTDSYDAKIDAMYTDIKVVGKVMFFWFKQKAPAEQTFTYELLYDSDLAVETKTPTLYIRSRKTNTPAAGTAEVEVTTCFGFDMSSIVSQYKDSDTKTVRFNIMYYTGVDADGKDKYEPRTDNPLTWPVED